MKTSLLLILCGAAGCDRLLALGGPGVAETAPLGDGARVERGSRPDDAGRGEAGPSGDGAIPAPHLATADGWGKRGPLFLAGTTELAIIAGACVIGNPREAWLVGDKGWMVRNRGDGWRPMKPPAVARLNDVWLDPATARGWIVGAAGTIVEVGRGSEPALRPSPVQTELTAVDGAPPAPGPWISGRSGVVLELLGGTWKESSPAGSPDRLALEVDPMEVWTGGGPGEMMRKAHGSIWVPLALPAPSGSALVKALQVVNSDLWVGVEGGAVYSRPLATGSWNTTLPARASLSHLFWKPGMLELWASGGNKVDRLLLTGASWLPVISDATRTFQGLWSNGPDLFACASGGNLYRCPGTQAACRRIDLADTAEYQAIHLAGGKRWLAGTGGTLCVDESWGCERMPNDGLVLPETRMMRGVWSSGAETWAVGDGGTVLRIAVNGALVEEGLDTVTSKLYAITGTGAAPTWVASANGFSRYWPGSTPPWKFETYVPGGQAVRALWMSGVAESAWGAGDGGRVYRRTAGKTWEESRPVSTYFSILHAIHGRSDSDVWAVGEGGMVLHYTTAWSKVTVPCQGILRGVWVSPGGKVWIVGHGGLVCHFDGASWTKQDVGGITDNLLAVRGTSESDIWVVGSNGAILHFDDR